MIARGASFWLLWPTVGVVASLALAGLGLARAALALGALATTFLLLFLLFFRDPDRAIGQGVVSPADGRVLAIDTSGPRTRIAIFMAPWSVHVNRAPLSGTIERSIHRRGAHRPAFSKDSVANERVEFRFATAEGPIEVALIAGTVARRVRPYVGAGDTVAKGERIAVIAFGSRCELTLPEGWVPLVPPGTWVRAGSTTLGARLDA